MDSNQILKWLMTNWLSLIAITIAAISAYYAFRQNKLVNKLSFLHITPSIKCMFDYPDTENPIVVISNSGSIPIKALTVDHEMYLFDKESSTLKTSTKMDHSIMGNAMFREVFNPSDILNQELLRVDPVIGNILIYKFR